jgi:hypothetical protein
MNTIQAGDTVRHKTFVMLNGGLAFNVLEVNGHLATCNYFDEKLVNKQTIFDTDDLIVVHKAEGLFLKLS